MATITTVKERILQLDAGNFQILCDRFLSKEGYPNIISLGTEAGTSKTTRGTPDTYFSTDDGAYIFVEYTTQQTGLIGKIRSDLKKCLDASTTQIPLSQISEIIYCHTSSNIEPQYDREFKEQCKVNGVKLTILGIDEISERLMKYPSIIKDHLGLNISTEQIQSPEDFIKQYNSNRLAATLSTPFLFREKELQEIESNFQNFNLVILSGAAGSGKTRLALQYANQYAERLSCKLFCIHDKAIPLYDELQMYLEQPGRYFLVIDDANQLSQIKVIAEYANKSDYGYEVKILITVRDYALTKVKEDIQSIVGFGVVNVEPFTDDQIKSLAREALGILNSDYLNRIAQIAEGNARMAMFAGKIAADANRLDSINDVSQLYFEYFSGMLDDAKLKTEEPLLIVAGVMAFLGRIHLDRIDPLLPFLKSQNIDKETFYRAIKSLHDTEVVDVYHDKAVRFSEQCFANFILKYVFYDRKLISLKDFIAVCFVPYHKRVVDAISTLINVFGNTALREFVVSEINELWRRIEQDGSLDIMRYVQTFHVINPTATLLYLKKKIDHVQQVEIEVSSIDTQKDKNNNSINDPILTIIGQFADSDDLETALDLFFQYYLKRPDLYTQFYHVVDSYFLIEKNSYANGYYTQIKFIEKIVAYSDNFGNEFIKLLFLDIAPLFLQFHFTPWESNRRDTGITIYNIDIVFCEGVSRYRSLVWQALITILEKEGANDNILRLLFEYGSRYSEKCDIVNNDIPYIIRVVQKCCVSERLEDCIVVKHLHHIITSAGLQAKELDHFINAPKMQTYLLLVGPEWDFKGDYHDNEQEKKRRIETDLFLEKDRLKTFRLLVDICSEIKDSPYVHDSKALFGLDLFVSKVCKEEENLIDIFKYAIESDCMEFLRPRIILDKLFECLARDALYDMLCAIRSSEQKNVWMYAFYSEIPVPLIDENVCKNMLEFLADTSDKEITSSTYRDIEFLDKYIPFDSNVFQKGISIILRKREYSPFMTRIYLWRLFCDYRECPEKLFQKFRHDFALLEDAYIWLEEYEGHIDGDGHFLLALHKNDKEFLHKYISSILTLPQRRDTRHAFEKFKAFYECENYVECFDVIADKLVLLSQYPLIQTPTILNEFIVLDDGDEERMTKALEWICHYVSLNAFDLMKMKCIFEAFCESKPDAHAAFINTFLRVNQSFEFFEQLPLLPSSYSYSNSAVPLYLSWIKFLEKLLPALTGLKFVEHKAYILEEIEILRKRIVSEEIDNILEG